jgi:hypothetical protein
MIGLVDVAQWGRRLFPNAAQTIAAVECWVQLNKR